MYSENELESAVTSGVMTQEAADALRAHVSAGREAPMADEEQFRLVTSFNDIFVALAGILFLVGAGWIGGSILPAIGSAAVAAAAWGLAEVFTRKRRMAFPSIVFYVAYAYGIYILVLALLGVLPGSASFDAGYDMPGAREMQLKMSGAMLVSMGAAWVHWQRFRVPLTVASGVGALVGLIALLVTAAIPQVGQWLLVFVLMLGLGVFWYAMRWDMQDRERKTGKADVAFWLHLLASPLIVHPVFVLMGMNFGLSGADEGNTIGLAFAAIAIYILLAIVALIVDRRAILVSALVYVLAAVIYLFAQIGSVGINIAFAVLFIGASLLAMSAFWQSLRAMVLPKLPEGWRANLPAVDER